LPVVEELRELPAPQNVCPLCGAARRSRPATPRTPNRSRSRSGRIADASDGGVISGHAPARTVLGPAPRRPRPS
jgi:hypothetical protein